MSEVIIVNDVQNTNPSTDHDQLRQDQTRPDQTRSDQINPTSWRLTSSKFSRTSGDSMHVMSLSMRSIMADVPRWLSSTPMLSSRPLMCDTTTSGRRASSEPTVLLTKLARRGLSGGSQSRKPQSLLSAVWMDEREGKKSHEEF